MSGQIRAYLAPVIVGMLGVFACLGLARFAFGMVLPDMQLDLGMNATQAGIVGSANFLGYFLGLFVVPRFYKAYGPSKLIARALWGQGAGMLLMATSSHYLVAALVFTTTGFLGALANIAIMTYISQVVPAHIKGRATGIVVAGIGLAVISSGILVPLFAHFLDHPWRASWGLFGVMVLVIGFVAQRVIHRFSPHASNTTHTTFASLKEIFASVPFWQTGILFLLFGTTAIMLMTFFVAAVQEQWQTDTGLSGIFWAVLGVTSIFSGPVFGAMSDKIGRYQTLAILFALQALAHGLIALGAPLAWIMLSAGVFGLSTWAVPSIMATLSSELFGMANTARVLSLITIFFGIGQIVGPLMAGIMRDMTGSFTLAFTVSTGLLCFAVLTALAASRTGRKNR